MGRLKLQHTHFRAIWVPSNGMFNITFRLMEKGSLASWDVQAPNFLKMIEHAEQQLEVHDGQNVVGKQRFHLEVVDKHNNDVEINLLESDRATFTQLVAYLRKVYDSWKEWDETKET